MAAPESGGSPAPDSGREFRAALRRIGRSQTAFARELGDLGDPRPFDTRLRTVQELARPGRQARMPWYVHALIGAVERLDRAAAQAAPPGPPPAGDPGATEATAPGGRDDV